MTINTQDTVLHSQLAGLGSPKKVTGFMDVPSTNVNNSSITTLPDIVIPVKEKDFFAVTMVNFDFEDGWRVINNFSGYNYDLNYNLFDGGNFSTSSPTNRMCVYVNQAYKDGNLIIQLSMTSRSTVTNPINVKAFRASVVSHIYKPPFKS